MDQSIYEKKVRASSMFGSFFADFPRTRPKTFKNSQQKLQTFVQLKLKSKTYLQLKATGIQI